MAKNNLGSNDPAPYEERVKKTIRNMENAEAAMDFADGKELFAIKEKNARRKESLGWSSNQSEKQNDK